MKRNNKPHEVKYSKMVKEAIEKGRALLKEKEEELGDKDG